MTNTKYIKIDTDTNIGFEIPNSLQKIKNFLIVPILNNLPKFLLPFAIKTHKASDAVVKHKTEHLALEILYQKGLGFSSKNIFQKIAFQIWFGLDNLRAVRNRLKIVKREIQKKALEELKNAEKINILSIAAGSARAVLESISNVIEIYPNRQIYITFLDKNPKATQYSYSLAEELQLLNNPSIKINWVTETVGEFMSKKEMDNNFNIIEMVGLLDYFNDEKAVKVFKNIKSILKRNGLFVCANINFNREQKFITNFIGWHMIYRSGETLVDLLQKAGFKKKSITAVYEPLKIHSVTSTINL